MAAAMNALPAAVAIVLGSTISLLPAQTVAVSASALTPLTCTVTVGTVATTQTVPAGPVSSFGQVQAGTGGPFVVTGTAALSWSGTSTPTNALMTLNFYTFLNGADRARVGPGEMLVTFAGISATARPVRFEGVVSGVATSLLQLSVDIGNNGTIDWQFGGGPLGGSIADLTTQPLVMRVLFDALWVNPGTSSFQFALRVVPDNGIHVIPMATSCGLQWQYSVEPLFDTSVADLMLHSSVTAWHVLGLQSQPAMLPQALTLTPVPCLLVPRPDLVLRTGTIFLQIPQAVRPIVLFTQLVDVTPGLLVSDAFQVVAF
jgi:hypothetical protein